MNSTNLEEAVQIPQPNEEQQPHKKKVRRKRQSSQRFYKQMPLNMAEARREIKTALKLHRASIIQKQIKQSLPQLFPMIIPMIYIPVSPFYFHTASHFIATRTLTFDHYFKTLNTNSSVVCNNNPSYFCSPCTVATHQEVPKSISLPKEEGKLMGSDFLCSNNIGSMEESGKEIKKVMDVKNLEIDDQIQFGFDNVAAGETAKAMEFPDWLNLNDDLAHHHNSNYHSAEVDCLQQPDLSCLDIGEIEDVDGDWLA